jgi:hypothetical protein
VALKYGILTKIKVWRIIRIKTGESMKHHTLLLAFMVLLFSCENKSNEKTVASPSTIKPETAMNPQLNEFIRQVKEKMEGLDASSGQEAVKRRRNYPPISPDKCKKGSLAFFTMGKNPP